MQKRKILDTILKLKELIGALAAITLWILALWFTNKLAPYVEDINLLKREVSASTARIDSLEETSYDTNTKVTKITCYLLGEDCLK